MKKIIGFQVQGFWGKVFYLKLWILEIEQNLESLFDSFLKSISQNVRVKLSLFQEFSHDILLKTERIKALKAKGFLIRAKDSYSL